MTVLLLPLLLITGSPRVWLIWRMSPLLAVRCSPEESLLLLWARVSLMLESLSEFWPPV